MKLYIQIEQEFSNSLWYISLLHGIEQEARKKRYEMTFVSNRADLDTVFGDDKRLLIVIGTSIQKLSKQLLELQKANVEVLLVNITSLYTTHGIHSLSMDYEKSTLRSLEYLRKCGKHKTALFCINPDSGSDVRKQNVFLASGYPPENCFINTNGLSNCCEAFLKKIDCFDSVLCANDIAVLGLRRRLWEQGIRVPEDLFLMGFGDIVNMELLKMGDQFSPSSITTVTIDHEEIGRQVVCLYAYLCKTNNSLHITGQLDSILRIGATTAYMPEEEESQIQIPEWENGERDFYDDAMVAEIIRLQRLVAESDELDKRILQMLVKNVAISEMAENLYITQGAVTYRLKQIYRRLGVASRKEAIQQIQRYMF